MSPEHWSDGDGDREFRYGNIDQFWELVSRLARFQAWTVYRLARDPIAGAAAGNFLGETPLGPKIEAKSLPLELSRAMTTLITNDACLIRLVTSGYMDNRRGFQPGELATRNDTDINAIKGFALLHELAEDDSTPNQRDLALHLLGRALEFRRDSLVQRSESRQEAMNGSQQGISMRELTLLAHRSQFMIAKYGAKRVERIFEQRLALLFQSFGFTVIQARPGEEAADLLCIARVERFSFLIDAKSSQRNYSLPRADQRALTDYARGFSERLPDLPPLEMILVVSFDAAGTVPNKLRALEADAKMPFRFVPISVLTACRENIPGPVSPHLFREVITSSDPIVGDEMPRKMKEASEGLSAAYLTFVRELRQISGQ